MATKNLLADEDGNLLPELEPQSGIAQIITLLEYARRRGFKIGPTVQVGDTIVQVRDLRQERDYMERGTTREPSIWEEAGHVEDKE